MAKGYSFLLHGVLFYNFRGERQICWAMKCPSELHKDALSCHPPGVREHTEERTRPWKRRLAMGWGEQLLWFALAVQEEGHMGDQACVTHRTQCLGLISQKLQWRQPLTHMSVHIKSWGDLSYVSVTLTETSGPRQLIKESI